MSNNKDWWKFYIPALEETFIANEQILNKLIKFRNSFVHSQDSSANLEQEFERFLRNLSKEDIEILLRDFNDQIKVFYENGNNEGGIAHYRENGTVRLRIEMPQNFPSTNQSPGKFLNSFLYLIPKKFREEYIGDQLEIRVILEKKGLPKWWINFITTGSFLLVLITSRWTWFLGLISSVFKNFKEFIQ